MEQWEKDFAITKLIIRAIYASVFIYAGLVCFRILPIPYVWERTQQIMFFVLLIGVPPAFFISTFIGNQIMSPEKLDEKFHAAGGGESGLSAAVALVRTGAVIMAAIGEASAIYGFVLYFMSGDIIRPFVFFLLSAAHYPLTIGRLSKAYADIEKLARGH